MQARRHNRHGIRVGYGWDIHLRCAASRGYNKGYSIPHLGVMVMCSACAVEGWSRIAAAIGPRLGVGSEIGEETFIADAANRRDSRETRDVEVFIAFVGQLDAALALQQLRGGSRTWAKKKVRPQD